MSTSDPSTDTSSANQVVLPPGVSVGAGRETSQINPAGQVVQGMVWPITLESGTSSTVFVPNTSLGNVAQVQKAFTDKITALQAVPGV